MNYVLFPIGQYYSKWRIKADAERGKATQGPFAKFARGLLDWLVSVAMIHSASHNLSSALTTAVKPAMNHRL